MSGSTIGGIDSSIPLQAGKGVASAQNPLTTIGQFAATQNALNANKLFPGQLQLQNQAVQSGGISLAQKVNQAGYAALTPLLAEPNITHDRLTTALASIENNLGLPTSGILSDITSTAPSGDGPDFSNRIRALIASRAQSDSANAVNMVTPQAGPILDNGQSLIPTVKAAPGSSTPGQISPYGAAVPTFPSQGQLIGQVQWQDGQGVTHYGTAADYATAQGQGGRIGPSSPVAGANPGAPTGGGGVVGVGGPVSPQNPPRLSATAPHPSGSFAGPEPGTPEFKIASASNANAANTRAATFQSDMFPLTQAQTALAAAPTGKGSEAAHNVSSYLNTFAPAFIQKALSFVSPVMTPDEVTAYDEAKKYLTQGTLGTPGATRSNEGLGTAGAASPSTTISKEAAQIVLRGMIGLRRMEQESTLEFNNSGLPPAAYNKFQTDFATRADPRVYMFDQLDPGSRTKMIQGMSATQRSKFWDQVHVATQNGILTPPQAANGQ